MALRIIRKSASQSHVEIIKGSATQAPRLSLTAYLSTLSEAESMLKWRTSAPEWLRTECEWILMRGPELKEVPRPQLQPGEQSLKILSAGESKTPAKQLQTLIKEASSPFSLVMVQQPPPVGTWLENTLKHLESHPDCGAAGPVLMAGQGISAAGWTPLDEAAQHTLIWDQQAYPAQVQAGWHPLLQGLPFSVFKHLAPFRPVPALSEGCILRNAAVLALEESCWEQLPDTALVRALCLELRKAQYWVHVVATLLEAPAHSGPTSLPPLPLTGVYQDLGFVPTSPGTYAPSPSATSELEIEAYLAHKDAP